MPMSMDLAMLVDPDVYKRLSDRQLEQLSAHVDAAVTNDPEIMKMLKKKVESFIPKIAPKV
jgi:hypothetical protein